MSTLIKRFREEYVIISVIVILLISVLAGGFFSYKNLKKIINDSWISPAFNDKMVVLKDIMFDVLNAEATVKSFYLTHDKSFLPRYFELTENIANKANSITTDQWGNEKQKKYFDTLSSLLETKFEILNELIYLQNNEYVTDELNKITQKINEIKIYSIVTDSLNSKIVPVDTKNKKNNFFKRLFKSKKSELPPAISNTTVIAQKNDYAEKIGREVKKEITEVKKSQIDQLREIKSKELELSKRDIEVNNLIQQYIYLLETNARDAISKQNKFAIKQTDDAIYMIGGFCLLIILLLTIVSYFMIRYIIFNKVYRKTLKKKQKEASLLAEEKQNILSNMSHEIRTPLNSIIGFSNQISTSGFDNEQQNQLDIIKKSSNHLLGLINNILDYSKLDAGKFSLQNNAFDPAQKIKDVFDLLKTQGDEKGLSLKLEISDMLPKVLLGDGIRFSQVILNILSNAIKYSEKGEIIMTTDCSVNDNGTSNIKIVIIDNGVGIPKEKMEAVFNQFEQASTTLSHKGTGLGLSIAKKLAQLQGGDITIESEENIGTKVIITFSIEVGKISDLKNSQTADPSSFLKLKNKKILIADDEPYNRILLTTILNKYSANYVEVKNGNEVLQKLQLESFDIILMDIRMPEKNGIEACKEIRAMSDKKIADIPIIALTAGLASENMKICMNSGMNDFISKPYKEEELIQKIANLIYSH